MPDTEGPVLNTVEEQLRYERAVQMKRYDYHYTLSDSVAPATTQVFTVTIDSGADFKLMEMTGSALGYDSAGILMSAYPMPLVNAAGALVTRFAMRGLMVQITDSKSGRNLTSGFVGFEVLFTPGYGVAFQKPREMRYLFYRNSKIRFDIRNTEPVGNVTHSFNIALHGYRYETPPVAGG